MWCVSPMTRCSSGDLVAKRSEDKHYVLPENLGPFGGSVQGDVVIIHIPFPPSVNMMYRQTPRGIRLSTYGREYKDQVTDLIELKFPKLRLPEENRDKELTMYARFYQPDRRRRDMDNLLKASLDVVSGILRFDDKLITRYQDVAMEYDKEKPRAAFVFRPR